MPFSPKDWKNLPATTTPLSAAALEDLEERVTDYTDARAPFVDVVQDHGAVGDGEADDSEALQDGIEAAITAELPLYLPPGEYRTTKEIKANASRFFIYGAGSDKSVIVPEKSEYDALVIGKGEVGNRPQGYARDFSIGGGNAEVSKTGVETATGKAALKINGMSQFEVRNVVVYGAHDIGASIIGNCYGTHFHDFRCEYDDVRVGIYIPVGTASGEDLSFYDCWVSGEVAAVHITQGKNYRFIGGQYSASRQASEVFDLRGVFILGKDYLSAAGAGNVHVQISVSIEAFKRCWGIRSFKECYIDSSSSSFDAGLGGVGAIGVYKNASHSSSYCAWRNTMLEGTFTGALVVREGSGGGSIWYEDGTRGTYTDETGETNAFWNNMAKRCEVPRAYGWRNGENQMCGEFEMRVNETKLQASTIHKEEWKEVVAL